LLPSALSRRRIAREHGPFLLDIRTNPDATSIPPKPTVEQGWGFAIAKLKETLTSRE
jgi:pyruvate dehydrogenase (quinone)